MPQPLSKGLQNLWLRYTRHINRSQGRVGHLFQGRYKGLLVDADRYGLERVRYIHLNPVRARLRVRSGPVPPTALTSVIWPNAHTVF
jgi:hypothetical protein